MGGGVKNLLPFFIPQITKTTTNTMESTTILEGRYVKFTAPSGYTYSLREQNGEDDDVLSNAGDARNLMNISKFIAGIVIDTSFPSITPHKLTAEEAHKLPVLDRYCILIQSRIHSLGQVLEFSYDWPKEEGGKKEYEVDLSEYLLDYSLSPTPELLASKPEAIPYYFNNLANEQNQEVEWVLTSGKRVKFSLLTGESEARLLLIPENDKTKNSELLVRDLKLWVDSKWVPVTRFHLFNPIDMKEIRNRVKQSDPIFSARTEVVNPSTNQVVYMNIMALPDFFYLGEM